MSRFILNMYNRITLRNRFAALVTLDVFLSLVFWVLTIILRSFIGSVSAVSFGVIGGLICWGYLMSLVLPNTDLSEKQTGIVFCLFPLLLTLAYLLTNLTPLTFWSM